MIEDLYHPQSLLFSELICPTEQCHNRKAAGSPKKNKILITRGINSYQQIIVAANSGDHDDIRPFRETSNSEANHRASAEEKRLCCKIRAPSGCQTFSCSQCGKTYLSYMTIMNYLRVLLKTWYLLLNFNYEIHTHFFV